MRHQLAAYSPVSGKIILRGAVGVLRDQRKALEDELMLRFSARDCSLYDSGTHALQVAIRSARVKAGTHCAIALPAFNCYDVATAAIAVGGDVMLYDIDPSTLAPDHDSLERVLAAGARIVVIAPMYGIPVDWVTLAEQANRHGAVLIEDAAQGHGGSYEGKPIGSLGEITTLSFGRGKGWTGGGGGAVLLRGSGLRRPPSSGEWKVAEEFSLLLGLSIQWVLGRPGMYGIPRSIPMIHLGETRYRAPSAEREMTKAGAAALLRARADSDVEATARRAVAEQLIVRLGEIPRVRCTHCAVRGLPGYLRFPVRIAGGIRGLAASARAKRLGVTQSYPTTLAQVPALTQQLVNAGEGWPGAEELARDLITIPTHSLVSVEERNEIIFQLMLG